MINDITYFTYKLNNALDLKPEKIYMWPFVSIKTINSRKEILYKLRKYMQDMMEYKFWEALYRGQ